jgi:hypothetical protein
MKIQPINNANLPVNAGKRVTGSQSDFKAVLQSHLQPLGITGLIKDAFTDLRSELLREIDKIAGDETGKHIEMDVLDELLSLYQEIGPGN